MEGSLQAFASPKKPPKYRASCDFCNEAKVRCSQTRPSCARCVKQDVHCVYGVSQRYGKHNAGNYHHKNASRPSANTFSATIGSPVSPPPTTGYSDWSGKPFKYSSFDNLNMPNEIYSPHQLPGGIKFQTVCSQADSQAIRAHYQSEALSYQAQDNERDVSQCTVQPDTLVSASEIYHPELRGTFDITFKNPTEGVESQLTSINPLASSCVQVNSHGQERRDSPVGTCRCNEIIIALLAKSPVLLRNERCDFDVELVQFKEAINLCTRVLACPCAGNDESSVLTISTLIARILNVFERGADSRSQDIATQPSQGSRIPFRNRSSIFSLGEYQFDGEEESILKQEMWRLQFGKVEAQVASFKEILIKSRQQCVYQDSIQAEAWEKLHLLFDQKTQCIKRRSIMHRGRG